MEVPQFGEGECEVRALWDNAVAEAMGWDRAELARRRELLSNESHVRGLSYNQYEDEIENIEDMEPTAAVAGFRPTKKAWTHGRTSKP